MYLYRFKNIVIFSFYYLFNEKIEIAGNAVLTFIMLLFEQNTNFLLS